MMAAGAKGIELPMLEDERRRFDRELAAAPQVLTVLDRDQLDLRRALGVA